MKINLTNNQLQTQLLTAVTVFAVFAINYEYVIINGLFIIGLLGFTYILWQTPKQSFSIRLIYVFVPLIACTFIFQSNTFLFLSSITALCFTIESQFKKIPILALFLLIIISPISYYFFETFGFEIKLLITQGVVNILQYFIQNVTAEGNIILINGDRFIIDTACMGLRMTGYAFTTTLLLFYYYLREKEYSFVWFIAVLCLAFILNIFSNFSRILLLVVFRILPNQPAHYLTGIACFIFYSILPILAILPQIAKRFANKTVIPISAKQEISKNILFLLPIIALICAGCIIKNKQNKPITLNKTPEAYKRTTLTNGTIMLNKQSILVYVKPLPSFLSCEHNPALCWSGSGYEICYVARQNITGKQRFTGILKKQSKTIFTAWWITHNKQTTINQLEWRSAKLFYNETCCLINVSANTYNDLLQAIKQFDTLVIN